MNGEKKEKEGENKFVDELFMCVCIGETHTSSPIISKHLAIVFLSFFSSFFFHTGQLLFRGERREEKAAAELHEKEKREKNKLSVLVVVVGANAALNL